LRKNRWREKRGKGINNRPFLKNLQIKFCSKVPLTSGFSLLLNHSPSPEETNETGRAYEKKS
jgi:hypothetical protein